MNANRFLPPPVRLSQAFESEKFSGGASGSEITRRSFIKRTGGATVATLVAWNLASRTADARVELESEGLLPLGHSYSDSYNTPNWKIRVEALAEDDVTLRSSVDWDDNVNNTITEYAVALGLKLQVSAPQSPASTGQFTYGPEAESVMTVTVTTFAKYVTRPVIGTVDWVNAPEMELPQLNRFLGRSSPEQAADTATTTAQIKKSIVSTTGEVIDEYRMVNGVNINAVDYDETYAQQGSGITIGFAWDGDVLVIDFVSDVVPQSNNQTVEPIFVKRNDGCVNP
jgi:hypothetical protein